MLAPPSSLPPLAPLLRDEWGIADPALSYQPLGFGSHHWDCVAADGRRWFITVDELWRIDLDDLCASLSAALALRDHGCSFVVAPVLGRSRTPVLPVGDAFAVAVYPHVSGSAFEWGPFSSTEHRFATVEMVAAIHA